MHWSKYRVPALALVLLGWLAFFAGLVGLAPGGGATVLNPATRPAEIHSAPAGTPGAQTLSATIYLPLIAKAPTWEVFLPPIGNVLPPAGGADWLAYVNYYRALAGLPALPADAALSDGAQKHAHYMVAIDTDTAYESFLLYSAYFTPEGNEAAQKSNLFGSSAQSTPDEQAIATWMQGPFHALGLLDPALRRTGFGSDRDASGVICMAAALDVISGLDGSFAPAGRLAVAWPGNGATVYLRTYTAGTDSPEPLSSCPSDYPTTTGLPITLQIGNGSLTTVAVTASALKRDGTPVEFCWFTENTYTSPDSRLQTAGRGILGARDAIVLVPREPLTAGSTYAVSVTANDWTYQWSFKAAP
jgi:uncharacterized protein YkwD